MFWLSGTGETWTVSEEWGMSFSGCGQTNSGGGSLDAGIFFSEGLRVCGCMVFASEPILRSSFVSGRNW